MTQRQSFQVLIVAAIVAMAIIASATALVALHDLDAAAYATLLSAALTATGFGSLQLGQKALNGGVTADLERLAKVSPDLAQTVASQSNGPPSPPSAPPSGDPPTSEPNP